MCSAVVDIFSVPDTRELILSRLQEVMAVEGIVIVVRNALDVPFLSRPAVVIQDGSEERINGPRGANYSQVQQMDLTPQIWLMLRGTNMEAGPLMSLYRGRILYAVFSDMILQNLVGTTGAMRYDGCTVIEPTPETKEPRMDLNFTFTYTMHIGNFYSAPIVGASS